MSRECQVCGKSAVFGNSVSQRGKAKYLGGNGRKTTGITRRQFRPNLQKIRVQDGGSVKTKRVCTSCIRSGKIEKAVVRKPFTLPSEN
jgi:large subunit ribosomal protein L28